MHAREVVQIVETEHHFLYLALHHAQRHDWFDFVPRRYRLDVVQTKSGTDAEAYLALKSGHLNNTGNIAFAVCDPAQLIRDQDAAQSETIAIGGLITNAAFWAVDRKSHDINDFRGLSKFDKLIAYPKGSTSFEIARRIASSTKKSPGIEIQEVHPRMELAQLAESPRGTLALTPDLLNLEKLKEPKGGKGSEYRVELALGATPEYSNVLVTALLSTCRVLERHPDLVKGLLRALQRALLEIQSFNKDVIASAAADHRSEPGLVERALRAASNAQVFPTTLEISEAQWLKAADVAIKAQSERYDEFAASRAREAYRSYVLPYRDLAREALRNTVNLDSKNEATSARANIGLGVVLLASPIAICSYVFYLKSMSVEFIFFFASVVLFGASALGWLWHRERHELVQKVYSLWIGMLVALVIAAFEIAG